MSWRPTCNPDAVHQRSALLRKIRDFFYDRGFLEVQTPVLSRDTVVDRHIDPIEVDATRVLGGSADRPASEDANGRPFYLQTSPEFAMKRLLATGLEAIFQICPAFRSDERGKQHNQEFTMVEWYRIGDALDEGVKALSSLVESVTGFSSPSVVTYQTAFLEHAGINPMQAEIEDLWRCSQLHGIGVHRSWSDDRDDWLNLLFAEIVQPQLGLSHPTIVTHYPASQSALARLTSYLGEQESAADDNAHQLSAQRNQQPVTAERFELFIGGVELANGYHELTDGEELKKRNAHVNQQRAADGKKQLPGDSRLLAAMRSGMPSCSGCALGLDRLLMVVLGLKSIDDVLPFPIERC